MEHYLALLHWGFLAAALIVSAMTEFVKRVFALLPQNRWVKLFTPKRLFPAVLGGVMGLIPGMPAPEMVTSEGWIASVVYFATAGIFSAWMYGLIKKVFEDILPNKLKDSLKSIFSFGSNESSDDNAERDDNASG